MPLWKRIWVEDYDQMNFRPDLVFPPPFFPTDCPQSLYRYMFDFCGILTVLVASSAVFLNLLLIVIILFYARTALGKYKYALIALSLFEIIFALGLIFALPVSAQL
jgi:hypothetical protein